MKNQRRLFRYIAYALLVILTLLLLLLYSVYLSAQRSPRFYRVALATSKETLEFRNKEMRKKIISLNNDVQKTDAPWQGDFSADDLNAFLAIEAVKGDTPLFPPGIVDPRLSFSAKTVDVAFRVDQGPFTGVLNLSLGLTVPEPNRITLRLRSARLGTIPISKDLPLRLLTEALEKKGYAVVPGTEAGDPTLSFSLDLKYGKDKILFLENFEIVDGAVRFSGTTVKRADLETTD